MARAIVVGCEKVASMGCHARRQWARGQSVKAGLSRLMPLEGVNVRVDCGPASGRAHLGVPLLCWWFVVRSLTVGVASTPSLDARLVLQRVF
jgi:hypothetical protein